MAHADLMVAWGRGGYGQLGDGTLDPHYSVQKVPALTSGVSAVAGGSNFSLAVKEGALYSWGRNDYGQLGNGGISVLTVKEPMPVPALSSGVQAIAGGSLHGLAIRSGGLYAWGFGNNGQLGQGPNLNHQLTPVSVPTLTNGVTAISVGEGGGNGSYYSLAVRNGTAYGFGYNGFGQIGDGTYTDRFSPTPLPSLIGGVTAISAGGFHAMAVRNGAAYAWGYNGYGQLGRNTADYGSPTPMIVPGLGSGVTSVAAGCFASLAVVDGNVYAWGFNENGELGLGDKVARKTPTLVPGLSNIVSVVASDISSYALDADGSLWVWGGNGEGQLGLGDIQPRLSPVHLLPPAGYFYTSISGAGQAVLATLVPEPTSLASLAVLTSFFARRRRSAR